MGTILKNILNFTGLIAGDTVSLPHLINLNDLPMTPDLVAANTAGFTVTANDTDVTVTKQAGTDSTGVRVYVELWHSIEDVEPQPDGIPLSYFPFVFGTGLASTDGAMPLSGAIHISNTNVTIHRIWLFDSTAGSVDANLPLASSVPRSSQLAVKNLGTAGQINVTPAGGDLIDGISPVSLLAKRAVTLASDGVSAWYIVASVNYP